eukprot:233469-Rhodomonas_salina.1
MFAPCAARGYAGVSRNSRWVHSAIRLRTRREQASAPDISSLSPLLLMSTPPSPPERRSLLLLGLALAMAWRKQRGDEQAERESGPGTARLANAHSQRHPPAHPPRPTCPAHGGAHVMPPVWRARVSMAGAVGWGEESKIAKSRGEESKIAKSRKVFGSAVCPAAF